MDKLEQSYPCLTRKCFRYAQRVIRSQTSYSDLTGVMNSKAASMDEVHEATKFNSTNALWWFKREGGNLKSPVEKPSLIPEMKRERVLGCLREKKRIRDWAENFHACFLDEKWFYTTSQRRKLKVLPSDPGEDPAEVAPHVPTIHSRRFPVKVRHKQSCFLTFFSI